MTTRSIPAINEPDVVDAYKGMVFIDGPELVAMLSPERADELSHQLLIAAANAKRQQIGR